MPGSRKNNIALFIAGISAIILLYSCVNVKSDYPSIEYYRLKQMDNPGFNLGTIEGLFQIRDFTISDELETGYLMALTDDTRIKRYYYHRWIGNCSEMITDFFVARYNKMDAFTQGVVRSSSVLTPLYIMEGQVLDMMARNSEASAEGISYVSLSVKINVIKIEPLKTDKQVILSKVFNTKIPRRDNSVTTIPIAYSQAFSEIADLALAEIHKAIDSDIKARQPGENSPAQNPNNNN